MSDLELVKVVWRDAWFEFERGGVTEERDDYLVETVGWVDRDQRGKFLSVVSERLPDDDGHRAVTHVPRVCIINVWPLADEATIPEHFVQEF